MAWTLDWDLDSGLSIHFYWRQKHLDLIFKFKCSTRTKLHWLHSSVFNKGRILFKSDGGGFVPMPNNSRVWKIKENMCRWIKISFINLRLIESSSQYSTQIDQIIDDHICFYLNSIVFLGGYVSILSIVIIIICCLPRYSPVKLYRCLDCWLSKSYISDLQLIGGP